MQEAILHPSVCREHQHATRRREEIAAIKELLCSGHPDIEGLCRALTDWSGELRLLRGA